MIATCADCGATFERPARETWRAPCVPCWKIANGKRMSGAEARRREVAMLRAELARRPPSRETPSRETAALDAPDRRTLGFMVRALHPDRHGGDVRATEALRYVNALRDQAGGTRT